MPARALQPRPQLGTRWRALAFQFHPLARLDQVADPEVLLNCAQEGRILVSHDIQTMPVHFREFTRKHRSPGAFLVPQDLPVGLAVETLLLVWAVTDPREWENRLCLIPSLVSIVVGSEATELD